MGTLSAPSQPHGYSGTPLPKKLGIKAGFRVLTLDAPPSFPDLLVPLPDDVVVTPSTLGMLSAGAAAQPSADLLVAFFVSRPAIIGSWPPIVAAVGPLGVVWVAWPKKSSGVTTDITEDALRADILPTGWVDVKVCAIDATWSGLKFVLRRERRP